MWEFDRCIEIVLMHQVELEIQNILNISRSNVKELAGYLKLGSFIF